MNSKEFVQGLHDAILKTCKISSREPTQLRPFICDGSPLDCDIFVVGLNPASNVSWEPFWDTKSGIFNKADWLKNYERERNEERAKRGKRPMPRSKTRLRIESVVTNAKPHRCLETNIYSYPTASGSELLPQDKLLIIFDYLLYSIRPKVLHLHGDDAIDYFEQKFKINLPKETIVKVDLGFGFVSIYATPHFASREKGMTNLRVENWGKMLKSIADWTD